MYPPPGCPVVAFGIPHPRYFGKRGCKVLKTKGRSWKLKIKRLQAIETARVRAGVAAGVSEVGS
jgi:ribosomal protein L21E